MIYLALFKIGLTSQALDHSGLPYFNLYFRSFNLDIYIELM